MNYKFQIFSQAKDLPQDWNSIVAPHNILLSREYFQVLDDSQPINMKCYFGGFFLNDELIGGGLFQYLDFQNHETFQSAEISCGIRNIITKKFVRTLLLLGNNMLTGQNAFYFNEEKITSKVKGELLQSALSEIQKTIKKPSLVILKDFSDKQTQTFKTKTYKSYFPFSVQPNMVFKLRQEWTNFEAYKSSFSKKYQQRITSARKKSLTIEKKELDLEGVKFHSKVLHSLYHNVAENASINTFFLPENHFKSLKENLGDRFKIFGYFEKGVLVGFYTIILNGKNIDTYFLGYNKEVQKEMQLYLNMLLDMINFGIEQKFSTLIFGRTALEIKSTIGAVPEEIFGLIKHNNKIINSLVPKLFPYLEPKSEWIQRNPSGKI
ncbi:8-amino-7-oxononanoate synthase [Chryseobacterium sp. MP_3.2]|uniref:8-amino-7-oxononanoate synthase n=1 Tax=Chryseobacterium sp. MP_3.2 TaxID=3071712 RepID=UPI002DF86B11|nr:hypothetical protein [Chryseobacterium sp. MP_3.2]